VETSPRQSRRPAPLAAAGAALILFAAFGVPLINANRFRDRIREALEGALGRRVEIGNVAFHLLTGPGFRLENVIIGEDPAFGAEPFAYMASMQARVRLRTLWTGRVQLASLDLEEPSLNLVKNLEGRWNFEGLLERAGAPEYFPYIGIDSGRVNFKVGETKALFHFQDVEAALSPPRDAGGRWWMRFAATPARADRLLAGAGRLRGQGAVTPGQRSSVHFDVQLEDGPMAHLLTLVHGQDFGVHGEVGARLRLSGELSRIQVAGALEIGDVHRWDLLSSRPDRLAVKVRGEWNLPGQQLRLETEPTGPVKAAFQLEQYLSRPAWKGTVELEGAPVEPLVRAARHFGASWPEQAQLRGAVRGRLEFQGWGWPRGALQVEGGRWLWASAPPVDIGTAEVQLEGPAFELRPVEIRLPAATLELEASGRLDRFQLVAVLSGAQAPLEGLRGQIAAPRPPWLDWFSSGEWDGRMVYRKPADQPGAWSGSGVVRRARWQPEGLPAPVEIAQARVKWEADGLAVEAVSGSAGQTRFSGSCRQRGESITCQLRIPEMDWAALERWLNPERRGSRWAWWRRLPGAGPPPPAWLEKASLNGTVQVGRLRLGPWTFRNAGGELTFQRGTLTLSRIRAELGKGTTSGAFQAEFRGPAPRYSLQASARGVDVKSLQEAAVLPANFRRGSVDARLALTTAGRTTAQLRSTLRAGGVFEARSLFLGDIEWEEEGGEVEIRSMEGRFEWTAAGLALAKAQVQMGAEVYQCQGHIGGQPQILLNLASGNRQQRLASAAVAEASPAP